MWSWNNAHNTAGSMGELNCSKKEKEMVKSVDCFTVTKNSLSQESKRLSIIGRKIMKLLGSNNRLFLEYEIIASLSEEDKLREAYRLGYEKGFCAQQNAQQNIIKHLNTV